MNGYVKACELAEKWGLTDRQIQIFCKAGKIPGAVKFGPAWAIPEGAIKPTRTAKSKPGPRKRNEDGSDE